MWHCYPRIENGLYITAVVTPLSNVSAQPGQHCRAKFNICALVTTGCIPSKHLPTDLKPLDRMGWKGNLSPTQPPFPKPAQSDEKEVSCTKKGKAKENVLNRKCAFRVVDDTPRRSLDR